MQLKRRRVVRGKAPKLTGSLLTCLWQRAACCDKGRQQVALAHLEPLRERCCADGAEWRRTWPLTAFGLGTSAAEDTKRASLRNDQDLRVLL